MLNTRTTFTIQMGAELLILFEKTVKYLVIAFFYKKKFFCNL